LSLLFILLSYHLDGFIRTFPGTKSASFAVR
jgi:hypothetical protein